MNLYTVGHSNQSVDDFLNLIKEVGINCILDVRSMPYSKHTPQFNRENFQKLLKQNNIIYAHFGEEFGARRNDCLVEHKFSKNGKFEYKEQVDFELGCKTENFQKGVKRLEKALSQGLKVSLMCSEANPIECHRFSFISRFFYDKGWNINHIMRNNFDDIIVLSHQELEKDMIDAYIKQGKLSIADGQGQQMLFPLEYSIEEQRLDAYKLKNLEIGYCISDSVNEGLID